MSTDTAQAPCRNAPLAICDVETTGLDAEVHEIWEVALITVDELGVLEDARGAHRPVVEVSEHHWFLPVDLGRADAKSLEITRYHERTLGARLSRSGHFARGFAALTRGRHLVGAVPSFDEERLRKLLRRNGACPEWHYHLVDVEALVAGKLGIRPPWVSDELSRAIGVDPEQFVRHSAMGDARWARALYEAVFG